MRGLLRLVVGVLLGSGLACTEPMRGEPPQRTTVTSAEYSQGDWVRVDAQKTPKIQIHEKALGKDFLLQPIFGQNEGGDGGYFLLTLKSRILSFKRQNQHLLLIEKPYNKDQNRTFITAVPFAKFNILDQKEGWLEINLDEGFSTVQTGVKEMDEGYNPIRVLAIRRYETATINSPVIENVTVHQDVPTGFGERRDILTIAENGVINSPVNIHYFLSPYRPDPSYRPKDFSRKSDFGFFQVSHYEENSGEPITYAARFHPKKTIRFYISDNFPKEYRESARKGALYWAQNNDLKMEVLDAPPGIRAPHPYYNMIQWMDCVSCDAAYAVNHIDPLTGEILRADLYIPNALSRPLGISAWLKYPAPYTPKNELPPTPDENWALRGCALSLPNALVPGVPLPEKSITDWLSALTSHEMGHALGFTHNFLGSNGINVTQDERDKIFNNVFYKKEPLPDGFIPGYSVRDYPSPFDAPLIGTYISLEKGLLASDAQSIATLYSDAEIDQDDRLPLCWEADPFTGGYRVDCNRYDSGANVFEYADWAFRYKWKSIPGALLQMIQTSGGRLAKAQLNAEKLLNWLIDERQTMYDVLVRGSTLLSIQARFNTQDSVTLDDVNQEERQSFKTQIDNVGPEKILFPIKDREWELLRENTIDYLQSNLKELQAPDNPRVRVQFAQRMKKFFNHLKKDYESFEKKSHQNFLQQTGKLDGDQLITEESVQKLSDVIEGRARTRRF